MPFDEAEARAQAGQLAYEVHGGMVGKGILP